MQTPTHPALTGTTGSRPVVALIVPGAERRELSVPRGWNDGLQLCDTVPRLLELLAGTVAAVVIEPRDREGRPVSRELLGWVRRHPAEPVIVWMKPTDRSLREVVQLAAAGADVRVILRPHEDLVTEVRGMLASPALPDPGAAPAILRQTVPATPFPVQPTLALAALRAWPHLTVERWALLLDVTPSTVRAHLHDGGLREAHIVADTFTALEVADRLSRGWRLRTVIAAMGVADARPVVRRLKLLGRSPSQIREEGDFRELMARAAAVLRRRRPIPGGNPLGELDAQLMNRYLAGSCTAEERVRLEEWLGAAPSGAAEALAKVRRLQRKLGR